MLQRFYEREMLHQQPQESQPNFILSTCKELGNYGLEKAKNKVMNIFSLMVSFFRVLIWFFYHPRDAVGKAKDKLIHFFRFVKGLEKNLQKRFRNASMCERFTLAVVLFAVMIFAIFLPTIFLHRSSVRF